MLFYPGWFIRRIAGRAMTLATEEYFYHHIKKNPVSTFRYRSNCVLRIVYLALPETAFHAVFSNARCCWNTSENV